MNNLKDFKDGFAFTTTDIKKLPTSEENKTIIITSLQQKPIDLNKMKAIIGLVRQIKINKKKFPQNKGDIDAYYRKLINSFFNFEIGTDAFLEQCKQYSTEKVQDNIVFENKIDSLKQTTNNDGRTL